MHSRMKPLILLLSLGLSLAGHAATTPMPPMPVVTQPPIDSNAPMIVEGTVPAPGKDVVEEQTLVTDGKTCAFHDVTFNSKGSSAKDYPCTVKSATPASGNGSGYGMGNDTGTLNFILTLPEGPHDYYCNTGGVNYNCNPLFRDPVSLKFAGLFHGSRRPLPPAITLDATDQRYGLKMPDNPVPGKIYADVQLLDGPVHYRYHLILHGLDCKLKVDGVGTSVCEVQSFDMNYKVGSILVSGAFFQQPDIMASVQVHNVGGYWFIVPMRQDFFTPKSSVLIAVQKYDVPGLQALIAQHADVNAHAPNLDSPLASAIMMRHPDMALLLIDAGADVNATIGREKQTLLIQSVQNDGGPIRPGDPPSPWGAVVKDLLKHGAVVDAYDGFGVTALMMAAFTLQPDMVETLMDAHADPKLLSKPDVNDQEGFIAGDKTAAQLVQDMQQKMASLGMQSNPLLRSPAGDTAKVLALLGSQGPTSLPGTGVPAGDFMRFVPAGADQLALIGTAGAAEKGETVVVRNERTGVEASGPTAADGSFRITIAGAPADYYAVTLKTEAATGTTVYLNGDDAPLDITLDGFVNYKPGEPAVLKGSWKGPKNVELLVSDGKEPGPVLHDQGRFLLKLNADPSQTHFSLNMTTLGGLTISRTVKVGSAAAAPTKLDRNAPNFHADAVGSEWGLTPDLVEFQVAPENLGAIKSISLSAQGDGRQDVTVTDPAAIKSMTSYDYGSGKPQRLSFTYTRPGLYAAVITITTVDGQVYQDTAPVLVKDPAEMDVMFTRMWRNLSESLMSHDLAAARAMQWRDGHRSPEETLKFLDQQRPDLLDLTTPLKREKIDNGTGQFSSYERKAEYSIPLKDPKAQWPYFDIRFIEYPGGLWHVDMLF